MPVNGKREARSEEAALLYRYLAEHACKDCIETCGNHLSIYENSARINQAALNEMQIMYKCNMNCITRLVCDCQTACVGRKGKQ